MTSRDRALAAVCDTFVPGDQDRLPSASALGVPQRLRSEIEALHQPALLREFDRLLDTIDSPVLNAVLSGRAVRFSSLSREQREDYLRRWAGSRLPLKRRAFQVLKRLTLLYTYGAPDSPYWEWAGYTPPALVRPAQPAVLTIRQPGPGETVEADACVIGCGAGGGVAAAVLAARGKRVVVLERAVLRTEREFDGRELAGFAALFVDRGIASTEDRSISLLAGSAVGGGTVVNWSTSLRLPASIRHEWRSLGVDDELDAHYDAVEARLDIDTDESPRNGPNAVLERGLQQLGLAHTTIPRNVRGCGDCGHCGFGCRPGAKQSTLRTYLVDACRDGAEILHGCEAVRLELSHGRVTGVVAQVTGGELRVRAPLVALAGGSLLSPALLLRSGVGGDHAGRHLALHPTVAVAGIYDQPVRLWSGVPQSVVSEAFADLVPGYGFRIECPPALPGILAASVPWWSATQHRQLMAQAAQTAAFIAIVRDREGGRVTVDRRGQAQASYRVETESARHLIRAMIETVRIHRAAGARQVATPHTPPLTLGRDGDLGAYEAEIERRGVVANRITLFSAHQMSTCRMGAERRSSVTNPDGQVWNVAGLYVTDASAFPASSGVNPMLTVMALARRSAQRMP
ncbi:MAG: GMC family oxidoreductase N-terminal domain-containing protein [Candidatus Dormibacteraeota bacterium]|nr:GMC family oxidoreductase N-terminal domain-containing protein [Candidatus Dormibacteraeota bacterium]